MADSQDVDDQMRQVIVFRLRPSGPFVTGGLGPTTRPPAKATVDDLPLRLAEPANRELPIESLHVLTYLAAPSGEPIEHVRREAELVQRYGRWLDDQGRRHGRQAIRIPGELGVLYTDLYDHSTHELIEAKASAYRDSVRAGLGQLFDYARFVEHERRSLLLPTAPRPDLLELLRAHGCGCIWETDRGRFDRLDR